LTLSRSDPKTGQSAADAPALALNGGFRHEALFYAGEVDFVERTSEFIRDAVGAGEPVLVVVSTRKIELLRAELVADVDKVWFTDMAEVGENPARIIPVWREFVDEHAAGGRPFRGVGEPIWATRTPEELAECERHESLLNLAFASSPSWWLVCPYDTDSLDRAVLEESLRNHPAVLERGIRRPSAIYRDLEQVSKPFAYPLPEAPAVVERFVFGPDDLGRVRSFVLKHASSYGLSTSRLDDLVLAVNEVTTNSVRHAGGGGVLSLWEARGDLVCEVRDDGLIDLPLAGRERPSTDATGGYGLWIANQLCELVQVRSNGSGSVVRLHMRLG
jgi:anti-sigma regulatory factor (Ser/Thr protein kinase)